MRDGLAGVVYTQLWSMAVDRRGSSSMSTNELDEYEHYASRCPQVHFRSMNQENNSSFVRRGYIWPRL